MSDYRIQKEKYDELVGDVVDSVLQGDGFPAAPPLTRTEVLCEGCVHQTVCRHADDYYDLCLKAEKLQDEDERIYKLAVECLEYMEV